MKNIDFKEIKPAHLIGKWKVKERILSKSNPNSLFALAHEHHFFQDGTYTLSSTEEIQGTWQVTFSLDLIRNPVIRFTVKEHTFECIITRLLCTSDLQQAQLTIYLSTGLELVLLKN